MPGGWKGAVMYICWAWVSHKQPKRKSSERKYGTIEKLDLTDSLVNHLRWSFVKWGQEQLWFFHDIFSIMFNGISIKLTRGGGGFPWNKTKWCFLSSIKLIDFSSKKPRGGKNERRGIESCTPHIDSLKSAASHFWAGKVGLGLLKKHEQWFKRLYYHDFTLSQHLMENTVDDTYFGTT